LVPSNLVIALAKLQIGDRRPASTEQIVKALEGDYRPEHLFALQTAVELYDAYHLKITECENKIEQQLEQFETKLDFDQFLSKAEL